MQAKLRIILFYNHQGLLEVEKQELQSALATEASPGGTTGSEEDHLTEVSDSLDLDLAQLDQQVALLAEGNEQLESERDVLIDEKVRPTNT